jgi:predicted aspartyl protease
MNGYARIQKSSGENQEAQAMPQAITEDTQFTLAGGGSPVILVPTYINDRGPYNFTLDTGATHSMISSELASNLAIQSDSKEQAFGAGGAVQILLTRVNSISVGLARQMNAQVYITSDLEQIGAALKTHVDGILGFSFMKDFRVIIDFQRNVLRLVRVSDNHRENSGCATPIPFTLAPAEPFILVQAVVNGQGPFQFALDTGAGRTVLMPELAERLNIRATKEIKGAGVGGKVQLTRATVDSLSVGGASVQDHAVVVGAFINTISAVAGTKLDGIIGQNFLTQFHVTIDYPRSLLTFALPPNTTDCAMNGTRHKKDSE